MALTYPLNQINNRLIFKRERSYLTTIVYVFGGLIFAFGSLAIPLLILKVLAILGGIGFAVAAVYLPSLNDRFVPEQATFDLTNQSVTFEMNNGHTCQLSFGSIKEFLIEIEKRSPSAANSAGIHYLHHHINLKRENEAVWTITTTTDAEEANGVQELLEKSVQQAGAGQLTTNINLSDSIQIEESESTIIRWEKGKYELSIGNGIIRHTEYKSSKEKVSTREFVLKTFEYVRYSYSATIKNRNWTIVIGFGDLPKAQLKLFFRDLNPVECLQLERWLEQTIQKKLSA